MQQLQADANSAAPDQATETILLAEDDDMVRKLTRSMLEKRGYKVVEARNADEAFSLALQHPSPIDLLLTDVIMPKGTGIELAHRILRVCPDVAVLYMSGYTDNALPRTELLGERAFFIQKPFDVNALTRHVKAALCRPKGPPQSLL